MSFSLWLNPRAMHIPDGFLNIGVALVCWGISLILLGVAARKTRGVLGERQVPLMGIMAAFIFAAQMINFPVAGGTSGHLLGGVLAAVTLGPWAAMLVMASVIGVQALLFQDGGLLVMGANILNMGLLTALIGYGLYRSVLGRPLRLRLAVIGVAAWLSVVAGALATSLELWLSGTAPLRLVVPAMLGVHALIGLGEAFITVAAVAFIARTRPDVFGAQSASASGGRGWVISGGLLSLLVVLLAPFASASPDGLERVAHDMGFIANAADSPIRVLGGYAIPWLGNTPLSVVLAGLLGVLVVGGVAWGISRALMARPAQH